MSKCTKSKTLLFCSVQADDLFTECIMTHVLQCCIRTELVTNVYYLVERNELVYCIM